MSTQFFDIKAPKGRLRKKIFIVEGQDDAYFFDKILSMEGADPGEVGILVLGGIGNLSSNLGELKKSRLFVSREVMHIAVLRDADYDPMQSTEDLKNSFAHNNFPFHDFGIFVEFDSGRKVGAYMLPPDGSEGNLESLLLASVVDDRRSRLTGEVFGRIETEFGTLDRRHKRLMQLYLACLPVDCRGVGRAFHLEALPTDGPVLEPIRIFVRTLLDLT